MASLKQYLPVSSRSFHAMHRELHEMNEELERLQAEIRDMHELLRATHDEGWHNFEYLYQRIETADEGINGNINTKFDCCTLPLIEERAETIINSQAERMDLYFQTLSKKNNEPAFEIRKGIFKALPNAEGDLRLHQLANAKLMGELHNICVANGFDYWFAYGTLVATLSRGSSIPWDDDIDICMMREDAYKLKEICNESKEWQVTTVFDSAVLCRQLRFSSRDSLIPCFIDISLYDWSSGATEQNERLVREAQANFEFALSELRNKNSYWQNNKYIFAEGSGFVIQYDEVDIAQQDMEQRLIIQQEFEFTFHECQEPLLDFGVYCDKEDAKAVSYGIDNIFDCPRRKFLWCVEEIFPTQLHVYEGYEFKVPHMAKEVADECCPGWPYVPPVISGGHNHFSRKVFESPAVLDRLKAFLNE